MTFDPGRHEYKDGDTILRSVTQILVNAGIIDTTWASHEAMERGHAVHDLAERYAQGARYDNKGRALASLEWVKPFADWMKNTGAYALETERIICGEINGKKYAGRYDLLALIRGKRVLVDIKTGARAKWHPTQLAAYSMAKHDLTDDRVNPDLCMNLYLTRNTYRELYVSPAELVAGIRQFRDAFHDGSYFQRPSATSPVLPVEVG